MAEVRVRAGGKSFTAKTRWFLFFFWLAHNGGWEVTGAQVRRADWCRVAFDRKGCCFLCGSPIVTGDDGRRVAVFFRTN